MDWIQSKQVMDAMGVSWSRSGSPAAQRICKRAQAGLLQARAVRFCRGDDCRDNAPVPPEFWWAGGDVALEQDWDGGDFSTWPKLGGGESCEWRAYGVEWSAEDLKAMGIDVLAARPAVVAVGEKDRIGAPISKRWPLFVAELALWIEEAKDDPAMMTAGKLIDKLNGRLAVKGIEEMPRSTADETVKAVLSALRKA